jgi:hypothetical protein
MFCHQIRKEATVFISIFKDFTSQMVPFSVSKSREYIFTLVPEWDMGEIFRLQCTAITIQLVFCGGETVLLVQAGRTCTLQVNMYMLEVCI